MNRFLLALALAGCASPAIVEPPLTEPAPISRTAVQEPAAESAVLRLEEALAIADREHPDLREARAKVEAARGRATQATAWPNPELLARLEAAGSKDEEVKLAGFSQSIPIGGRLAAAGRVEELDAERLELDLEARRRAVRGRVRAAYAAALYAQQALALLEEAVSDAEKGVSIAESLARAGDGLAIDVARAKSEGHKARLERDRARALVDRSLIEVRSVVGRRVRRVEGSLESALDLPDPEPSEHPAVKAARAGVRVQEARIDLARSHRIPDVNVDLLYRRSEVEDSFDVGLSVTLPIFNRERGAVREARAERRAAEARADKAARDAELDLETAQARLSRALATSKSIQEGLLAQQVEIARAYEARYTAGDASLSEVIPIRRELIAARLSYLESLREVMEARADLAQFLKS